MSTENDPTQPLRTPGSPDRDEPTAPVPRPGGDAGADRTDDPTLVFETFGDRATEPATAPLRTPVGDRATEPATAPLAASTPEPEPVGALAAVSGTPASAPDPHTGPAYGTATTTPGPVGSGWSGQTGEATTTPVGAGPSARPTLRVGTVVWGLIVALIGAGVVAVAAGARFDVELALIGLLALAGLGLVGGSLAAGMRRRQ